MSITRINTNYDAMFARQNLQKLELKMGKSMQRISSGERLTNAGDDPHAVSILANAKAQLGGIRAAQQTMQESIALLSWMDGIYENCENVLLKMNDLAVTAGNEAGLTTAQYTALDTEYTSLQTQVDGYANLEWNTKAVFGAADNFSAGVAIQIGPNAADTITLTLQELNSGAVGTAATDLTAQGVDTAANAALSITTLSDAMQELSSERNLIGVAIKRLDISLEESLNMEVNVASTVSSVGDADLALEISNLAKNQILAQSSTAILGQANLQAQSLLQLLG